MAEIITLDLVEKACNLTEVAALAILNYPGATWGPKWVAGQFFAPGLSDSYDFEFGISPNREWNNNWGEFTRFTRIAVKNLTLIMREKASSSVIVATRPWLLRQGEFLYVGGAYEDGMAAAASGAEGWANEAISRHLIINVRMLAFLETDNRIQIDFKEI